MNAAFRSAAKRQFSTKFHDPNGLFEANFTSPLPDIFIGLGLGFVAAGLFNVMYRKPQMDKLDAFHAKLKQCRDQGIFDREQV